MKKLKLKALELGANEVLTRAQLKNVLGGSGGITTTTGIGSCTETGLGVTCTSATGDCKQYYCGDNVIGICCDGISYNNHGSSCPTGTTAACKQ